MVRNRSKQSRLRWRHHDRRLGAGGLCAYDAGRVGVNPLNGSDGLENPDGDGFDVNLDGVLEPGRPT